MSWASGTVLDKSCGILQEFLMSILNSFRDENVLSLADLSPPKDHGTSARLCAWMVPLRRVNMPIRVSVTTPNAWLLSVTRCQRSTTFLPVRDGIDTTSVDNEIDITDVLSNMLVCLCAEYNLSASNLIS